MKTLLFLAISILLFSGCSSRKPLVTQPQIKYIYKTKYVYLPCKKEDKLTLLKLSNKKNIPKSKKVENNVVQAKKEIATKYRQPTPTKIYAPKKYTTRDKKKMDFMMGINKDNSKFIYMEGEFGVDTYKNFLKFTKKINEDIKEIKINSNGGVVLSAMRIGSFIKEKGWNTGIDKEMHCYSACGFVYFAGKEKSLQGSAKIGLHRPYIPNQPDTMKYIQKVKKEYVSYWRYIRAPMDLYYEMMDVDRDELFILDKHNIEEYVDIKIH